MVEVKEAERDREAAAEAVVEDKAEAWDVRVARVSGRAEIVSAHPVEPRFLINRVSPVTRLNVRNAAN